jgi:Maltokinase N-terminal cap domain
MAEIHNTTLAPTKLELLTTWLPERPWYRPGGRSAELSRAGGFRLDDPVGTVGIEVMAVTDTCGDQPVTYNVPLTYRGSPLAGADGALVGTTEHGVLGTRWVYDAVHDPVFVAQLIDLIHGEVVAQAQGMSFTPDRSVASEFSGNGRLGVAGYRVNEAGADGTDIHLKGGPGSGPAVVRVVRRLGPADPQPPGLTTIGQVRADWEAPGAAEARGPWVLVLDATPS